jgi:hypothetical protein
VRLVCDGTLHFQLSIFLAKPLELGFDGSVPGKLGAVVLEAEFPGSDGTIADARVFGNFSESQALLIDFFDSSQFEFQRERSFLAHD